MKSHSTDAHAFTARFDAKLFRVLDRTFPFDGTLCIETTDDELTVGRVNQVNTLSVTATIDADAFEAFDHETAGTTLVDGTAVDGLLAILQAVSDTSRDTFELAVTDDALQLSHCESACGGHAPRKASALTPVDVTNFTDQLTAEASINAPAAVESLYADASCRENTAYAELATVNDDAYLTMQGEDTTYATLGDPDHEDTEGATSLFNAEYIQTAAQCLSWKNNGTTVRWGDSLPVVLEMPATDCHFRAAVAPRIDEDLDETPLYEHGSELRSVGAATAGGFQ